MSFSEERFNTEIRYGVVGGPEFNTTVVTTDNGFEQRNLNWSVARGKWQCATDLYNKSEIDQLIAFFRARQGKFQGFRFKDWSDFDDGGHGVFTGITGSTTTVQMTKNYVTLGGSTTQRAIIKPVQTTIKVFNSGTQLVEGTNYSIDYTTGILTEITGPYTTSALTWTGQFDVPARFDVDTFNADFQGYDDGSGEKLFTISGLTIVEIKQ